MTSINYCLDDATRENVESLSEPVCLEWGGKMVDGEPSVTSYVNKSKYRSKTRVRSHQDAIDAFEKYTEFTEYVINERDSTHDSVIIVPCGSTKPVGASASHKKKINALRKAGLFEQNDVVIMSEPCTIFPHDMRLSLAATNYDFPPEYTEKNTYPDVFETMAQRIADWLDARDYDTVYPYLFARHQSKFDRAIELCETNPRVVRIPGASFNPETESYSGDQFKSTQDITTKIRVVEQVSSEGTIPDDIPENAYEFYDSHQYYASLIQ